MIEIINEYCDFNTDDLQPLEEKAKEKIIVTEIEGFEYKDYAPQGIKKLNILN